MIEPLSPSIWFQRLEWLRDRLAPIACLDTPESERLIRHAFHLTQLAPGPFGEIAKSSITEEQIESLLDASESFSAVSGLMNCHLKLSMRQHENGFHAIVSSEVFATVVSQEASCPEVAALAAWVNCLLAIKTHSIARPQDMLSHQAQHIYRDESRHLSN